MKGFKDFRMKTCSIFSICLGYWFKDKAFKDFRRRQVQIGLGSCFKVCGMKGSKTSGWRQVQDLFPIGLGWCFKVCGMKGSKTSGWRRGLCLRTWDEGSIFKVFWMMGRKFGMKKGSKTLLRGLGWTCHNLEQALSKPSLWSDIILWFYPPVCFCQTCCRQNLFDELLLAMTKLHSPGLSNWKFCDLTSFWGRGIIF